MKYIPFVAQVAFVNTRNEPIMALKKGAKLKPGIPPSDEDLEQQTEDQVEFLCELTNSPKFVENLKGTAAMDMPISARRAIRDQEAKAKATGRWVLEDEHARRIKAAYDDFAVPPQIAQNYIGFGRAMDKISDTDPLDKAPSLEDQLEEKVREVLDEAQERVQNEKPPGGLRSTG